MFRSMFARRKANLLTLFSCLALLAGIVQSLAGTPAPAYAATSVACQAGDFQVILPGGRTLAGNNGWRILARDLPDGSTMQVRGRYIEFDVEVSTFAVRNYTLTGAANPEDLTGGVRTPLFAGKVPDLGGRTLNAGDLDIQLSPQSLVARRRGSGVGMKIQAKDCATGGVFQVEPDQATVFTHTLAPGIFYFKNPYTGKINFGNGGLLRGKDSPQVATRTYQDETTTIWNVAAGGRMGGVLGEDAVELSGGASACTQDCQAQNQIRGSLPVTDPFFNR